MAAIDYPPSFPCPLLAGNAMQGSPTFDVSEFDYDIRHRSRTCGPYFVSASFVVNNSAEMKAWKDFYYTTTNRGLSPFNASWLVEGDTTQKEFRFAEIYSASNLGADKWKIKARFEMLTRIGDL